jgi:hypothetical protein
LKLNSLGASLAEDRARATAGAFELGFLLVDGCNCFKSHLYDAEYRKDEGEGKGQEGRRAS